MANQKHWEKFEEYRKDITDLVLPLERNPFMSAYYWFLRLFTGAPHEIKWLWQRVTRGYDDRDIWNLDHAITRFVYPRIKHFARWQREHGHSTPMEFAQDPAAWLEVLNKIEAAFETHAAEHYLFGLEPKTTPAPSISDYATESEYTEALEKWRESERNDGVSEGLALFAKYYRNLWD